MAQHSADVEQSIACQRIRPVQQSDHSPLPVHAHIAGAQVTVTQHRGAEGGEEGQLPLEEVEEGGSEWAAQSAVRHPASEGGEEVDLHPTGAEADESPATVIIPFLHPLNASELPTGERVEVAQVTAEVVEDATEGGGGEGEEGGEVGAGDEALEEEGRLS